MMETVQAIFGDWEIRCIPSDGGRIASLKYKDQPLLTPAPENFSPPGTPLGEYEQRPVYGYDDCFPSVAPGLHPRENYPIRDHGQLCWLPWEMKAGPSVLEARVDCHRPDCRFSRTLCFSAQGIRWVFELENRSEGPLDFLHVAHPLFPPGEVAGLDLPSFDHVLGEQNQPVQLLEGPSAVSAHLLGLQEGAWELLSLQRLSEPRVGLRFRSGIRLVITWSRALFPNLAIWWNRGGYPPEPGIARNECAMEPISGRNSNLADSLADGDCLQVPPAGRKRWEMVWHVQA